MALYHSIPIDQLRLRYSWYQITGSLVLVIATSYSYNCLLWYNCCFNSDPDQQGYSVSAIGMHPSNWRMLVLCLRYFFVFRKLWCSHVLLLVYRYPSFIVCICYAITVVLLPYFCYAATARRALHRVQSIKSPPRHPTCYFEDSHNQQLSLFS